MSANKPVYNPSPKARFAESDQSVTKHRDMVTDRTFERAADFALLEYHALLCRKEQNPAFIGLKLMGAQEFLQTMRLLAEKEELRPIAKIQDNLEVPQV